MQDCFRNKHPDKTNNAQDATLPNTTSVTISRVQESYVKRCDKCHSLLNSKDDIFIQIGRQQDKTGEKHSSKQLSSAAKSSVIISFLTIDCFFFQSKRLRTENKLNAN